MSYRGRRQRAARSMTTDSNPPPGCRLSIYRDPPSLDMSIEKTLRAAHDRLSLLRHHLVDDTRDGRAEVPGLLDRFTPSFAPDRALADVAFDDFMADQVSHFVLRALASKSTTTYDHFVKPEIALFRRRLAVETSSNILASRTSIPWRKACCLWSS